MMNRVLVWITLLLLCGGLQAQKPKVDKEFARYIDSLRQANPQAMIDFDTLLSRVYAQQPVYKTMNARTKLNWNDGKSVQDFQASIRLKKDSVIWGSLFGAMGVEGARIMMTPDSFKIINKLGNEYALRGFDFLERWLFFPVTFKMVQQVLAGQKVDIGETATAAFWQDSMYVIYYETEQLQQKIWVAPQNYTITKMLLKDKQLMQDMTITFDAYNLLNGKPFSYTRRVDILRGTFTSTLQVEVTRIGVDEELTFPFELNDRYKKVE